MSSTFNENNLIKKLEHVTNTQDSIQTLSLWVLHHKSHYKQIVEQWLKCFSKAKSSHQLALFYLANDIVQHAKRKSLNLYLNEFMNALREATKITNDRKITPHINRVFNIWLERNVYDKEFIDELRELLCGEDAKLAALSKIVSDFSLSDVVHQITNTSKVEQHTQSKLESLVNCKMDFANSELLNKLKDKSYGEQFSKEFDEATKCLDSVIGALEKEISARKELLSKLEKAKIFYDIQFKEANTVADAFNNCELRVKQVKAKIGNYTSSPQKATTTSADNITTSQLSSVMNFIQQAQNTNSISSLDQRLTSLMSNSGQFGLALNNQPDSPNMFGQGYDPSFQPSYNPSTFDSSNYMDQFYLQQEDLNSKNKLIEPAVHSRGASGLEPTENLEPADMDLGDSDDDDDSLNLKNSKAIELNNKNNIEDKIKRRHIDAMPFMTAQDISGLFPLIPPPPPPPVPPPVLKDLFGPPSIEDEFDPFRSLHNASIPNIDNNHSQGNSIRNLADRANRHSAPYHQSANSNYWRNPSDNRQPHRNHTNQSFNSLHSNSNHGNRWKNNNNRGMWKRNNYGSHH